MVEKADLPSLISHLQPGDIVHAFAAKLPNSDRKGLQDLAVDPWMGVIVSSTEGLKVVRPLNKRMQIQRLGDVIDTLASNTLGWVVYRLMEVSQATINRLVAGIEHYPSPTDLDEVLSYTGGPCPSRRGFWFNVPGEVFIQQD